MLVGSTVGERLAGEGSGFLDQGQADLGEAALEVGHAIKTAGRQASRSSSTKHPRICRVVEAQVLSPRP